MGGSMKENAGMKASDTRLIRLIAIFKLLKAALLIAVGIGAFKLIHTDITSFLQDWVAKLGLDPGSRYVGRALLKSAALTPNKIMEVGAGSFLYAGLFLTEGIGLWLVKRWAEWFSVIITSSLVPVEIYEIHRHPTALKFLALLINLAVVGYLLYRIRGDART
jgi:uncharacterized membrane protein (DUF2068 family)